MDLKQIINTIAITFIISACTIIVNALYDIESLKASDMVDNQRHKSVMKSLDRLHFKFDRLLK